MQCASFFYRQGITSLRFRRTIIRIVSHITNACIQSDHQTFTHQYDPAMTASTSFDGLLSVTRKLIMPSDLISRLQPKKKMPKTTVSASTHITAICTARMMNTLRSSSVVDTNPLSVTTEDTLQHDRKFSLLLLENKALSVSLKTVEFILNYSPGSPGREEQVRTKTPAEVSFSSVKSQEQTRS